MAIKKSELYSSLWKSCDELRGGMDASQYKDYILVLLFVKYVSDKYAGVPDALIEVPAGGGFQDIVNLKGNKDIGDGINIIIAELARVNDLVGIIKGFVKDGNKNRLREQDIHKIVDVFNKQLEIPKYARMVPVVEIASNDYNLNIPRYIDSQEEEDIQDIAAHLLGGIPQRDVEALKDYWQVYPTLQQELFEPANRPGYQMLKVSSGDVKASIFAHPEFISYAKDIEAVFEGWKNQHLGLLKGIKQGDKPKEIIYQLAENLLQGFTGKSLIDKYDVYQHLMTYWVESMKDDVYILVEDGWKAELKEVLNKNGKVTDFECELIPKELIINRYFQAEKASIETLETQKDDIVRQQEELQEEHGGEEGLLEEVTSDSGKVTKNNINNRLKIIKNDVNFKDELQVLKAYLKLIEEEAEVSKKIKEATDKLNNNVLKKYPQLTVDEIKTLVVDDKWLPTLRQAINSEMERISQRLTSRIKELAERYEMPLPELNKEVEELTAKVEGHLQRMGLVWLNKRRNHGLDGLKDCTEGMEGYKRTEVGVIPSDWEVKRLEEIVLLERGKFSARPRNDPKFFGGEIPFIQTGDVTKSNGIITTYNQSLNHQGLRVSKLFPANTLFFTIAANIGDVGIAPFETACPDSLVAITPSAKVNKKWIFHALKSRKKSFENLATQNAQLNINLEKLKPYLLPIPPLAEQKAIALSLNDTDELIAACDRAIAKKRNMQAGNDARTLNRKNKTEHRLQGLKDETD